MHRIKHSLEAITESLGIDVSVLLSKASADVSILKGLGCQRDGMIEDNEGNVVGKLVEGRALSLCKLKIKCDANGVFYDKQKKVMGRAQTISTIQAEDVELELEEESPWSLT
jgi:Protein of unknown function (DUF3659)